MPHTDPEARAAYQTQYWHEVKKSRYDNDDYRERNRNYQRAYRQRNLEAARAKGRARSKAKTPEQRQRMNLCRKAKAFGISIDEVLRLKAIRNCDICNKVLPETGRKTAIDHCHVTNKVRGKLCQQCNVGIGLFGENVEVLREAIGYLLKHKTLLPENGAEQE